MTREPTGVVWAALRMLVVCVLLVGSVACGEPVAEPRSNETVRYGDAGSGEASGATSSTTRPPGPEAPTSTTTDSTTTTVAAAATSSSTSSTASRVLNGTTRDDPSGFRLTFTLEELNVGPRGDVLFELRFENRSSETRYTYVDQQRFFVLATEAGEVVWSNDAEECTGTPPLRQSYGVPLEPGDSNRFLRRYPGERSNMDRDRCRVAAGKYVAHAFLEWCPRATASQRLCTPDMVDRIDATPMEFEVMAS